MTVIVIPKTQIKKSPKSHQKSQIYLIEEKLSQNCYYQIDY